MPKTQAIILSAMHAGRHARGRRRRQTWLQPVHAVPCAVVHAGAVSDPQTQILQTFIAIQDATMVDGGSAKLGYSLRTPCRALSEIQELDP